MAKKILIGIAALFVVLSVAIALQLYVYPKAGITSATQQTATDFTLRDATGQDFTLSSQRGHKVVLYFYRGYW
jgi:cytochrome oxidase Cu insertion factor (SCO1/SenC/PrrC family)